ncbi:MAG: cupin domain-containing protein [Candidatus Aenigmarchaeota archaeon]|nr:cupin domain-containing protein [Candidatus Aenigmarchaeota archaeon]
MNDIVYKTISQHDQKKGVGEIIEEILGLKDRAGIGLATAKIEKSKMHYHNNTTEIYYGLNGLGKVHIARLKGKRFVEGRFYNIDKGDMIMIPPGIGHYAEVEGKEFEVLVISSPAWTQEDHHLIVESEQSKLMP